jgi:hypothetical protein
MAPKVRSRSGIQKGLRQIQLGSFYRVDVDRKLQLLVKGCSTQHQLVTVELADYLEPDFTIGSNRRIVVLKHLEHEPFATAVSQSVNRDSEHLPRDRSPSIRRGDARRDVKRGGKALPLVDADQREADHLLAVESTNRVFEVDAVLDRSVVEAFLRHVTHV